MNVRVKARWGQNSNRDPEDTARTVENVSETPCYITRDFTPTLGIFHYSGFGRLTPWLVWARLRSPENTNNDMQKLKKIMGSGGEDEWDGEGRGGREQPWTRRPAPLTSSDSAATVRAMDRRRMGPRPPPTTDERSAAYESIFGRPSAAHIHPQRAPAPPASSLHYSASLRQPAPSSYGPPLAAYAPHRQTTAPTTSYYAPQQHHAPPASFAALSVPSVHSRARSVGGHTQSGVIVPQPPLPPDPQLEHLTRQGLTQAQAYQAHIYRAAPVDRPAPSAPPLALPSIRDDGGRLNINFDPASPERDSAVDDVHEDEESELPWASGAGQRTRE